MKIGIDCRMYSTKFTGVGKYTKELVDNLAKLDSENQYFLYFNREEFNQFRPPAPNFHKFEVNADHYSFAEQTKFALALYQTKPDLMHFTHFNGPIAYLGKQIATIHDLTLHFHPGSKYNNFLERSAYKAVLGSIIQKSKRIIAPTQHTAADIKSLYPASIDKVQVIYEGVGQNFIDFSQATNINPPKFNFPLPENYILYTGNWRSHKNLKNLFLGFEILLNQYGYKGKLILTGNPTSADPDLQKSAQKLQSEGHLITPGLIPDKDLPYLYYKADCYVFPSFYEGFGLPVLEAFSTNTPIVVSNSSCLEEIGQQGVLSFNPLDPQELALKVNQATTDPQTRSQLIEAGAKRLKDFSFTTMAQETLQIYKEILNIS